MEGAFRDAALTIRDRFTIQRHTGMPMETRGLVAEYNQGKGLLTVWGPTKVPHFNRSVLASYLGIPENRIHFIEPDVGGGFGIRGEFYPKDFLIPFLAMTLDRPVKWIEDRREHYMEANCLGCSEAEVRLEASTISTRNEKSEPLPLGELIQRVSRSWESVVDVMNLEAKYYFQAKKMTYPHGVQAALVEVDISTGVVAVKKLWSLYDFGRAINPMFLEGQIWGGVAQCLGGAFLEELAYDKDGQLFSTTFMDYPIAVQLGDAPGRSPCFRKRPVPAQSPGGKRGRRGRHGRRRGRDRKRGVRRLAGLRN